ncbi:glycoside hydrolase family 2 Gh2E [Butyrivibrio proteoclasticus B316]|uniref:Glycoside hydrolase family 2 Gh2E n=1 Tax=Butyrivibrio proteoclasticus (strain ATCC 51982 / DSM 14932 / B316) TaxID=515622 RepID=E0RXJ7_BUTPB|nr:glycoside hydrolase family 2 TIM barrel-domain containing protein [Butyrivibrio proteoclasticus]ADL34424.1 glycoside hydrolase family 2 Gh2E [Butyrivibrio proteoclasticus B316]
MRTTILWNDNWIFEKEGKSKSITLPHTWNAVDGQTGPEQYYRGTCLYKKTFERPVMEEEQRVFVEFRGANSSAKVVLNGREVASHDGGYSCFRTDITEALSDLNEMVVSVSNEPNTRVYPQKADFTFYGGIYRDVYLVVVDEKHFDMDYYGGKGLYVTPRLNGNDAEIEIKTYTSGGERVRISIDGVTEQEFEVVPAEDASCGYVACGKITIKEPHLWNGLKDPFLYNITATLLDGTKECDRIYDRFGVRQFHVDPHKGFFLNGESYPLRGVSRHQDRAGVGNALAKEMHREDIDLILSMGANSIRLAHYQHDQYFYDLCDEKGIVVWAEIPYITVHMDSGRENTISQMKELISQNYNHASIMCWALSNEISLQGVTEDLLENHRILNDIVHEMDPIRYSAMANLFLLETDSPLVTLPDIRGYNLYYGWYVGEMEDNDKWFDDFHNQHPDVAIGLTEYGADSVITLQSPIPEKGDYTESYQAVYHEHMLEMFSTRPYIWGTYLWNMFEFAAAGRDEAGDPGKNHKGVITFDRKQKKDAYYIYKAWWSDEPFVHLCGKRYHDRIEDNTEIKVYSNQKSVTLFVDGVEVGNASGEHVFKFNVPITGVHTIKAVSGELSDEMEIAKVSEPNPTYFAPDKKVRNWFDKADEPEEKEGYLSLSSTMAEIQAIPEGKAILDRMMAAMTSRTAGGMGEGVEISEAMQQMIARQPLKKLLQQGGMDIESDEIKALSNALMNIKKQ